MYRTVATLETLTPRYVFTKCQQVAKYFTQRTVFDITTILQEFLGPAKTRSIKMSEFKYFLTDFCLNLSHSFQVGC